MSARLNNALRAAVLILMIFSGVPGVLAQSPVDGFDPKVAGGAVRAMDIGPTGRMVIGGGFTSVGGVTRNRLARLRADGSLDTGFDPNVANGAVRAVLTDRYGDYLVGGGFTTIGGLNRNRLVRIDYFGDVDTSFFANVDDVVHAIAEVVISPSDERIYIGGAFGAVNGQPRTAIARITPSGSLDATFTPPTFSGIVYDIAVQADGKVLVAGTLSTGIGHGSTNQRIYRLNADGSIDPTFTALVPSSISFPNPTIHAVALQADGKVLIAGEFASRVRRLNPNGSSDTSYDAPAINATVHSLALQPDGRAVIGGDFTGLSLRDRFARLNHDGSLDGGFGGFVSPDSSVFALAVQGDGWIAIGGNFTTISGIARSRVARFNTAGVIELDFATSGASDAAVEAAVVQADGRILVGGRFTQINGASRQYLARFQPNGTLDTGFTTALSSDAYALAVLPDGKTLVGGGFATVNGANRPRLARLHSNGTLDTAFNAQMGGGFVRVIALQPDGKILVGGSFTQAGGQPQERIARLNANGSLDSGFAALVVDDVVRAIVVQPNGSIVIGGAFTSVNAQPRNRIARLNASGSLDAGFNPGANGTIYSLAGLASNGILAGGDFTTIGGVTRDRLAQIGSTGVVSTIFNAGGVGNIVQVIAPLRDGRILIGGAFNNVGGTTSRRLAMLTSQGALVPATQFDRSLFAASAGSVLSIAMQQDGKLVVGGDFAAVAGETRNNIARLNQADEGVQSLQWLPESSWINWRRVGFGATLLDLPQLLISPTCCNAADFEPAGTMQAFGNDWRISDFPALEGTFYLRVRARVGDHKAGASGIIETPIHEFYGGPENDTIFANGFD